MTAVVDDPLNPNLGYLDLKNIQRLLRTIGQRLNRAFHQYALNQHLGFKFADWRWSPDA